jgi:hypothetical protein
MKKRLAYQIVITLVTVTLLSSWVYYQVCNSLQKVKADEVGKINFIMHDTTHYNTVFFGSSIMHLSVNPNYFDSLTGYHSFNCGLTGVQITEISTLIKKYIQGHGAPQKLFICCDEPTLARESRILHYQQYYQYMNDTDFSELATLEPNLKEANYAPPLALNNIDDDLKALAFSEFIHPKFEYDIFDKGFMTVEGMKIKDNLPVVPSHFRGSERGWQQLEETILLCRQKNISVTLLIPPKYHYTVSDSSITFMVKLKLLADKYQANILEYTYDERFQSQELFIDRIHLSKKGAYMFTAILAKDVSIAQN